MLFSMGLPSFFDEDETPNAKDNLQKSTKEDLTKIREKQYINGILKNYERNPKNLKLEKKWEKAITNRIKKDDEYFNNQIKDANVLYSVKSKEKNLEMSYVNTKPITKRKKNTTVLTDEEIKIRNKEIGDNVKKFYTAPEIKRCENDFGEVTPNRRNNEFRDDEILDFLILSKNILQNIDKKQILNKDFFGNKNTTYFYSQEFLDMFSLSIKHNDIKCLPVRIIVTKNKIYRYYGVDALKFYDYEKNGVYHHWVKKHLNIFLG